MAWLKWLIAHERLSETKAAESAPNVGF